jgi:hypothetical protein
MSSIDGGSVLRPRSDIRFRVLDGEAVVVRQSAGEVLVLSEVAARILTLADGSAPVAAWVDTLLAEFEIDRPELERDVLAFAAELAAEGLLEPVTAGPARQGAERGV